MKIHHELERSDDRALVLALGFFDGVHRGHREILRAAMRLRRPGFRSGVVTFRNHPTSYLRPANVPALITTLEERINLLAGAGIDEAFVVPFDEQIASLEARAFLTRVIVERLRARAIVFGENFRFGRDRAGDAAVARAVLEPLGVPVIVVPALLEVDARISSTRIRAAIGRGDLALADGLLGEPYALRGRVRLGRGRGHELGFPTANLELEPAKLLPPDGVYTATARYEGADHAALVSIGNNPTFAGLDRTIEAWLRDFDRSLYGEQLSLRQLRFVREQRAFASAEELAVQMQEDATHVRFPSFSVR